MKLKLLVRIIIVFTMALLMAACAGETADPTPEPTPLEPITEAPTEESTATAAIGNLTAGCVEKFEETVDYFPEKTGFEFAEKVSVEYFNNYKTVTVHNPWQAETDFSFQYVLVQCGTPAPEEIDEATLVIEIPIERFVSMSTTQLPQLEMLDAMERLVAVESAALVSSAVVLDLIDSGEVAEVGTGAEVNLEVTLDLEPDLVMAFGYGSPEYDVEPFLTDAGIPTVLSADYQEATPLGRSEWLKFMALFFNKEAQANSLFDEQVLAYEALVALTADVSQRPTVFVNSPFGGTWFLPQGDSYVAQFLSDAGADYLWADEPGTGSLFLDFEAVFERAVTAEYWVSPSATWNSLADALAEDERYAGFEAFNNGVYNNNALVTDTGGNDYWERGVTQPDLVLADLIKIFHPDLLPDHQFIFFQHLQ